MAKRMIGIKRNLRNLNTYLKQIFKKLLTLSDLKNVDSWALPHHRTMNGFETCLTFTLSKYFGSYQMKDFINAKELSFSRGYQTNLLFSFLLCFYGVL